MNLDTKKHYPILDGLRGVASVLVIIYHIFEALNGGNSFDQVINHGYLAVDFFFVLSGFVVAYAYDDRWGKMTQWDFYKRRLVRLQPMVIMGSLIGAVLFYFQVSPAFPLIAATPVWKMLLIMIIGCTMIPVPISMDIRGWQEMHPLNGPAWSLFFEYVANIIYALIIRRFSKMVLTIFVILFGCLLLSYLLIGKSGDLIGGWAIDQAQLFIGFTRLLYPFFAGVLLCRAGKIMRAKNAFWWCSLLLVFVLCVPRVGDREHVWLNGLFEATCVILVFPFVVALGAGGQLHSVRSTKICKFLGDISYPLYITHFPLIYTYTAWIANKRLTIGGQTLMVGFGLALISMLIAYASLKLYDEPVREWLKNAVLTKKKTTANKRS